jgi:hypothetical protein
MWEVSTSLNQPAFLQPQIAPALFLTEAQELSLVEVQQNLPIPSSQREEAWLEQVMVVESGLDQLTLQMA